MFRLLLCIIIYIIFFTSKEKFLTVDNIMTVAGSSRSLICSLGATFIMLGSIDLSAGSMVFMWG